MIEEMVIHLRRGVAPEKPFTWDNIPSWFEQRVARSGAIYKTDDLPFIRQPDGTYRVDREAFTKDMEARYNRFKTHLGILSKTTKEKFMTGRTFDQIHHMVHEINPYPWGIYIYDEDMGDILTYDEWMCRIVDEDPVIYVGWIIRYDP